jgi:hypothetical protein
MISPTSSVWLKNACGTCLGMYANTGLRADRFERSRPDPGHFLIEPQPRVEDSQYEEQHTGCEPTRQEKTDGA